MLLEISLLDTFNVLVAVNLSLLQTTQDNQSQSFQMLSTSFFSAEKPDTG